MSGFAALFHSEKDMSGTDTALDRKKAFEEIEAILALEGFSLLNTPAWYEGVRSRVISGDLTHDGAMAIILENAKSGNV